MTTSARVAFPPTFSSDTLRAELYAITAVPVGPKGSLLARVRTFLDRGIRVVQIREKRRPAGEWLDEAIEAAALMEEAKGLLIMNDRADIAYAAGCHGVHVGQEDLPPCCVRRFRYDWIIGLSCETREEVDRAQANPDVDYLAIGPVYATPLKPEKVPVGLDLVSYAAGGEKPVVAIGGITLETMEPVIAAGARMVAMIRGLEEE